MAIDQEIKRYISHSPKIGDPHGVDPDQIHAQLRPTLDACQYWCKGMPAVCKHWENGDPGNCTYEEYNEQAGNVRIFPDGWNKGHCDFLGRRSKCNQYERKTADNLNEYICIAPNSFMTGLQKRLMTNDTPPRDTGERSSVLKADIKGYNEDVDDGKGQCDGSGTGKGVLNPASNAERICPYYRPWHMGFGSLKPKTLEVRDEKLVDKEESFEYYLPLSFRVFNLRAKLQKCYHWGRDSSLDFAINEAGLYLEEEEFTGRLDSCTCRNTRSDPYCTFSATIPDWLIIQNVWAESNSVICNGAKPECPCYTGNWVYCIDDKMDVGDRVSAHQIQELRFYFTDWESQSDFDRYFERRPNKNDATRSDIYTYGRWEKAGVYPEDSVLLGKRVHLCVPPVFWKPEFGNDYIQVEEITYDTDTGTNAPNRITFPTLVRDLDSPLNRLFVAYPYPNKDPFDRNTNSICSADADRDPCIKRNYYPDGNYTAVYGSTVIDATIYVFNLDDFPNVPDEIKDSNRAPFDLEDRETFYTNVDLFVEDAVKNSIENIVMGQAGSKDGFFAISRVKLEYKKLNKIIILANFGDGTWDFRKREVWSQWHGGVVVQSDGGAGKAFEHTYEPETRYLDINRQTITPAATASMNVQPMVGTNSYGCDTDVLRVMSVHMHRNPHLFRVDDYYYTYFIKSVAETNVTANSWMNIPGTLCFLVQIDDVELNQLFSWDIDSAKFIKENDDGTTTEIRLRKKYPLADSYYGQWYMHPNMCILEMDCDNCTDECVGTGFVSHDDWTLKIDYSYLKIDNNYNSLADNETVGWPNLDGDEYHFIATQHTIEGDSNYSITGLRGHTANIMTLFADEDGRLISAQATKLAVNIPQVYCRNVEIKYSYSGDTIHYRLEPHTGWAYDAQGSTVVGSGPASGGTPPCGDHDISFYKGAGPMWYPYDSCQQINFYGVWAGGGFCTMPYEGDSAQFNSPTQRDDYRYCGTEEHNAWVAPRGLWLADCATLWTYYHSDPVGDDVFTGYARLRANIDTLLYTVLGWALPPFGKYGREFVERYMSIDNVGHFSFANIIRYPREQRTWMPMVMSKEALYYSFNSFDDSIEFDAFHYVNPLNYYRSIDLNEAANEFERLRFDEVFEIVTRGPASYPIPTVDEVGSTGPQVVLYAFKDESYLWAWREIFYRDIERNLDEQYKLCFLNLSNMNYLWNLYKEEHRYITDEGAYTVTFTPPQFERETDGCNFIKYPSIKLGNGPERWFKVIYDDYSSSSNIDWQDENRGLVDGSGGGDNPYELTKEDSMWNHHNDTLFDEDYCTTYECAVNKDRELIIAYDALFDDKDARVYNRGVIATIPINRLIYLPYEIQNFSVDWSPDPDPLTDEDGIPGKYCWLYERNMPTQAGIHKINLNYEELTETACVVKIFINGFRGRTDIVNDVGETISYKFCRPVFRVLHIPCGSDGDIDDAEVLYNKEVEDYSNYFVSLTDAEFNNNLQEDYAVEIEFTVNPKRMITERTAKLYIQMWVWGEYSVCLEDKPIVKVSEYVAKTEQIWVWEQKYVASKGSELGTFNLDGPQKVLRADLDLDNSGIFFPPQGPYNQAVSAQDKMRSVACTEETSESIDIPVTKDTLKEVEATKQKEQYKVALNLDTRRDDDGNVLAEEWTYVVAVPPTYEEFFDVVGVDYSFLSIGNSATFLSEKIRWENHETAQSLNQYDFWRPGGHIYSWKRETRQARCYMIDSLHDIIQGEFVHVSHAGGFREGVANPVESLGYLKIAYMVGKRIHRQMGGVDFGFGGDFTAASNTSIPTLD